MRPSIFFERLRAMAAPVPFLHRSRSVVLCYHGVTPGRPLKLNTRFVSARRLLGDIRALRRIPGLRFVTLAQAMDPDCPGPKVALTFDDGYRGMLLTLLPLLEAEGVPACLFVTTLDAHSSPPGAQRMLWADRIDVAGYQGHAPFEIGSERFRLDRRKVWRRDGDSYPLKSLCIERNIAFLDAVAQACRPGPTLQQYWELLTAEDLRQLADQPLVTLGAHGITHANLPSLTEQDRWRELTGSKAWLENCVQQEITAFAYPHGHHTQDCVEEARRAGYSAQVVLDYQDRAAMEDPEVCNRIGIDPFRGSHFQRQVVAAGGYGHEILP
ncbi:polysaccharide deacetylase family protein [Pseudooceanicola sp.]|uniref:polysaccharide deacetylase family protein n=1 Tax=Pseudooceanicola sp. TaxID=1914328 RepID=UPI0035C693B7